MTDELYHSLLSQALTIYSTDPATALHLFGLALADHAWEDNGELLVKSGVITFMELPAYREEVFDMISARMDPSICPDPDFPFKVMETARKGKYCSKGMPTKTEEMLLRLGLPEWFIGYIKKVYYLPARARGKELLEQELKKQADN